MGGELGVLTRHEVEKLMKKVSRQRARVLKEFVEKAYALNVGDEMFQCYLACLPDAGELKELLNEGGEMVFDVWPTINGTMVKRRA